MGEVDHGNRGAGKSFHGSRKISCLNVCSGLLHHRCPARRSERWECAGQAGGFELRGPVAEIEHEPTASGQHRARRRFTVTRVVQVASLAMLCAVATIPYGIAEEAPPAEGLVPPPAGTDVETLRKLLGLPAQPVTHPAAAAPAGNEPSPQPQVEAPAPAEQPAAEPEVKAGRQPAGKSSKPKAVAKPVVKRAPRPVVRQAAPAAPPSLTTQPLPPAPSANEAAAEPRGSKPQTEIAQGSPQDIPPSGTVVDTSNMERWK